jgi:hypothetical protein
VAQPSSVVTLSQTLNNLDPSKYLQISAVFKIYEYSEDTNCIYDLNCVINGYPQGSGSEYSLSFDGFSTYSDISATCPPGVTSAIVQISVTCYTTSGGILADQFSATLQSQEDN